MSVPKSNLGNIYPRTGNAYAGIILTSNGSITREYIETKLISTLKENQLYCVRLFCSLAYYSNQTTDRLGVLFTKKKVKERVYRGINCMINHYKKYTPQINNLPGRMLSNKNGWDQVCGIYQAKGGEKYMTIGNFYSFTETTIEELDVKVKNRKEKNKIFEGAYYYIDDVSVIPITDSTECDCLIKEETPVTSNDSFRTLDTAKISVEKDHTYIMPNLYFEIDKSTILPESYPSLDSLTNYLKDHPDLHIEIRGHTDNTGQEKDNRQLSEERAKAVRDYLVSKGIAEERLNYKGYGSSKPIADNESEEGRRKNRRVEIRFLREDE